MITITIASHPGVWEDTMGICRVRSFASASCEFVCLRNDHLYIFGFALFNIIMHRIAIPISKST